ncbi:hypothetical protein BpHYR1_044334 [Brachionus plicatilis]|uniref:Uncharacterized protein n=1 Tax=Brachionus plicatilis TaxID=10195 RepID=A0A3M7RSN3_BRAPC|nr:hypothetical protein BpHYR1_044334 [Brachionus plicatilis]
MTIPQIVHRIFLYQIHISNIFHRKFNIEIVFIEKFSFHINGEFGILVWKSKIHILKNKIKIVSILDFFLKLILMKRFSIKRFSVLEISFSIASDI